MDKLLKPYVNITHIKHIYWPGTSTNVHSEGGKKSPSILKAFQDRSMQFLRTCQRRIHSNHTAKLLKFLFSHINVVSSCFLGVPSVPIIFPLPRQSPMCAFFIWLSSLSCSVSEPLWFPLISPCALHNKETAQELTSRLLFGRKYVKQIISKIYFIPGM